MQFNDIAKVSKIAHFTVKNVRFSNTLLTTGPFQIILKNGLVQILNAYCTYFRNMFVIYFDQCLGAEKYFLMFFAKMLKKGKKQET